MKKISIRKTLKIITACIAGLAMVTIPLTTIVSCSGEITRPINPQPPKPPYEDYFKDWNWESFARGEWDDKTLYGEIPIPNTINKISSKAVNEAGMLARENIFFSDWVNGLNQAEYIDWNVFNSFDNFGHLNYIEIPESIRYIGNDAFNNHGLVRGYLAGGLKFAENNNILRYGYNAFKYAPIPIKISPKIIKIDDQAFWRAKVPECTETGTKKVLSFLGSIEDIGQSAFKEMNYEGVHIDLEFTRATNLKNIGAYAFAGTKEKQALIKSGVSLPKSLKTFDFSSFAYTNITDIYAQKVEKIILPEKENPAITIDEWYPELTSLRLPLLLKPVVEANPDFFVTKPGISYIFE